MRRHQLLQLIGLFGFVFCIGLLVQWLWFGSLIMPFSLTGGPTTESPTANDTFVQAVTLAPDHFHPLYTTNPTSRAILQKIYPPLIGQDPTSGIANTSGLAERWQFTDEGRTVTLTLYPDWQWSDGEPLTSADVLFTYNMVRDPAVASPYRQNFANVTAVTAIDDRTVVVNLTEANCTILQTLQQPILPAHYYADREIQSLDTPAATLPTVGAGPFVGFEHNTERTLLQANPRYRPGAATLQRWEVRVVTDPAAQWAALTAGTIDLMQLAPAQVSQMTASPSIGHYTMPRDVITFVALNLADPQLPRPGRTAEGDLLTQPPHPILHDRLVRQALAQALDKATLLATLYGDSALPLTSYILPSVTWAYREGLTPYRHDTTAAATLLDEAGWLDMDGDGVRERNGEPLQLTLVTNRDSSVRVTAAEQIQTQLQAIGVNLQVELLAFDALSNRVLGQQFDLVLIGWENLGAEPANHDFWAAAADAPGSGLNFVSYQNEAVDLWLREARQAPACDGGYRALRYRRVQEQIHADLPYIIIGGQLQGWGYNTAWQGLSPQPWSIDYNVHRWEHNAATEP